MRTFECNLTDGVTIEVPKGTKKIHCYEDKDVVVVSTAYPRLSAKKRKFVAYKNRNDKRISDNHLHLGTIFMMYESDWYVFEVRISGFLEKLSNILKKTYIKEIIKTSIILFIVFMVLFFRPFFINAHNAHHKHYKLISMKKGNG